MNQTAKRIVKVTAFLAVLSLGCWPSTANTRVETVQFRSKLINASLPYRVVLPSDYNTSRTTRYPVLYLLHGLTGHYSDWVSRTNIADYASQYRLIVVTPEGNDGWYTDSASVFTDKYESYILQELIPDVSQRYRTIEARYGRAVAGLSMGGYGAIKFGLKSPATFVFAGSMSGAFGVTRFSEKDIGASLSQALAQVFGPAGTDKRDQNDLFHLIGQLPADRINALPFFYFDCGTDDSNWILSYNQRLADLMVEKKILHEYRQLPGDHSWIYWDQQVQEVLRVAARHLGVQPKAPTGRRTPKRGALA